MITAEIVKNVAIRFLGEDADITVVRSNGGFANPCGYEITVYSEEGSDSTFFHDNNTEKTIVSKMIPFVERVENCLS